MHQQTTFTNPPVSRDSAKQHSTVITYLYQNRDQTGTVSLYKTLRKNFAGSVEPEIFINRSPLEKKGHRFTKRTADIILSLVVILGILPWLVPIVAVLIKAGSRGPVFFLQKRNRKDAGVFTCIKFRSMVVNGEADLLPAVQNDTRITSVGRFMRRTFIDELPQFINVLLGDMSVIGPRPHMLSEHFKFEAEIPHYQFRHKVKPGITGLSQVMGLEGPANTKKIMNDRVMVDNFYVRHWTLKLDIVILYRTVCKMFGA
jgi:putative colanic acid biosysnthesis UDP-glucose lipid carrier transferase